MDRHPIKLMSDEELIAAKQSGKYPIVGFAPGRYMCKCVSCEAVFYGDKRAVQCEPCAIKCNEVIQGLPKDK